MNYVCYACDSPYTALYWNHKFGKYYAYWHLNKPTPFVLCDTCYKKFFVQVKWKAVRKKFDVEYRKRQLTYKGKCIYIGKSLIRTGICNFCRAVQGQINAQTGKPCKCVGFHHEQYDDSNPAKHIIEICSQCHGRLGWQTGQNSKKQKGLFPKEVKHKPYGYKMLEEWEYCPICKCRQQLCRVGILHWPHKRCSYCLIKLPRKEAKEELRKEGWTFPKELMA